MRHLAEKAIELASEINAIAPSFAEATIRRFRQSGAEKAEIMSLMDLFLEGMIDVQRIPWPDDLEEDEEIILKRMIVAFIEWGIYL